jgi:hypothetical protein
LTANGKIYQKLTKFYKIIDAIFEQLALLSSMSFRLLRGKVKLTKKAMSALEKQVDRLTKLYKRGKRSCRPTPFSSLEK